MAQRTRTKKKDRSCCFSWSNLSIQPTYHVFLLCITSNYYSSSSYLYSTWQIILFV
jgi:hypothetical protein